MIARAASALVAGAALFVCAAAVAASLASAAQEGESPPSKVPPKETFAFDIPDLDGGHIASRDLKGKIVIVDVWGTWCAPCRQAIPHLVNMQRRFGPRGLVVVGISAERGADYGTAVRRVEEFAQEMGINYRLGLIDERTYAEIKRLMRYEGESFTVPTTILLDRDGSILARYPGYFFGQEKELAELIRQRLSREGNGGEPEP